MKNTNKKKKIVYGIRAVKDGIVIGNQVYDPRKRKAKSSQKRGKIGTFYIWVSSCDADGRGVTHGEPIEIGVAVLDAIASTVSRTKRKVKPL